MAYGGRAYDDDKPWWQDDNDTTSSTKPSDDFDQPSQTNFHGTNYGGTSYGVYSNSQYSTAYDDAEDAYSRYTGKPVSKPKPKPKPKSKPQPKLQSKPKSNSYTQSNDPYEAIRAKSKSNTKSKSQSYIKTNPYTMNNAYDDHNNDNDSDSGDDFDKEPVYNHKSKSTSNGFTTKSKSSYPDDTFNRYKSTKPKAKQAMHSRSQSSRNVTTTYNRGYNNCNDAAKDHGVSNPAYRRQLLGNKYRNGHLNDEYNTRKKRAPRQRPELHTYEQQQQYKQDLRQNTMNHLDQSLRTAYQSEELAADTSEKLYYQRKKLENVDKMLHETDQNLDRTEHTLKGMKSIWGGINNYFKKAPERQQYEKRKDVDKININNKMMRMEKERAMKNGSNGSKKSKRVKLGGNEQEDDEFNDKLDELHKSVQRMRLMAQNMNRELDDQGDLLDNIDDKMTRVDGRIHKQNNDMRKIR